MARKREYTDQSCYDLAVQRMEVCFDKFDKVIVSFSGGKDSTACLQIALEAAKKKNKLPLEVFTYDEEAIPPETVEYMERVSNWPEVSFKWFCVPIQHRNACSEKEPYWYTWAPEDKHRWVRELPSKAITTIPNFKRGLGIADSVPLFYGPENGTICCVMGIRCQESMTRYRAIASKSKKIPKHMEFLTPSADAKWITKAYPVYDWASEDVWRAPMIMGWDYNKAYDIMEKSGLSLMQQRCAPPFGEQPIRGLHKFKTCWPELWGKMVDRVAGAATAARYANTDLYGCGQSDDLPEGSTWKQLTFELLRKLTKESQPEVARSISALMGAHRSRSGNDPIPDKDPHPVSGFCWRDICVVARVGGDKFNRITQKIANKALAYRMKNNIKQ